MLPPAGRLGILACIGLPARARQGTLPAYTFLTGFMFAFACLVCGPPNPAEHLASIAFRMTGWSRQDCSLKGTLPTNGCAPMDMTNGLGSSLSSTYPYSFAARNCSRPFGCAIVSTCNPTLFLACYLSFTKWSHGKPTRHNSHDMPPRLRCCPCWSCLGTPDSHLLVLYVMFRLGLGFHTFLFFMLS